MGQDFKHFKQLAWLEIGLCQNLDATLSAGGYIKSLLPL